MWIRWALLAVCCWLYVVLSFIINLRNLLTIPFAALREGKISAIL